MPSCTLSMQRISEGLRLHQKTQACLQATVMVVSVTASTTAGQPLSGDNLQKLLVACDAALQLDKDKADILKLVQMKMHHIAPNLSAAVGTEIAARLMGIAGGLTNLSKMPACNVQVAPSAQRLSLAGHV